MVQQILQNTSRKSKAAGRLFSTVLVAGSLLFAVLIGATFSKPHKAVVASPESRSVSATEQMKIAPADVLGRGSWSPLTGDSSN